MHRCIDAWLLPPLYMHLCTYAPMHLCIDAWLLQPLSFGCELHVRTNVLLGMDDDATNASAPLLTIKMRLPPVHTHLCTHTHMHTHLCTRDWVPVRCTRTSTYGYAPMCACNHVHVFSYRHVRPRTYRWTHGTMRTHPCPLIHAHAPMHMHYARARTHAHVQVSLALSNNAAAALLRFSGWLQRASGVAGGCTWGHRSRAGQRGRKVAGQVRRRRRRRTTTTPTKKTSLVWWWCGHWHGHLRFELSQGHMGTGFGLHGRGHGHRHGHWHRHRHRHG